MCPLYPPVPIPMPPTILLLLLLYHVTDIILVECLQCLCVGGFAYYQELIILKAHTHITKGI